MAADKPEGKAVTLRHVARVAKIESPKPTIEGEMSRAALRRLRAAWPPPAFQGRRRGIPSPDEADACALCFAGPAGAIIERPKLNLTSFSLRRAGGPSSWMSY